MIYFYFFYLVCPFFPISHDFSQIFCVLLPSSLTFCYSSVYFHYSLPNSLSLLDVSELLQLFLSAPHNLTFNHLPTGRSMGFCPLSAESECHFFSSPSSHAPNQLYLLIPIPIILPQCSASKILISL